MSDGYASPVLFAPRCWRCNRRLAEYLTAPYSLKCPRCHAENRAGASVQSPPQGTIAPTA